MRVVVTGSSGFIGNVLTAKLQSIPGIDVIAVSRTSSALTKVCVGDYSDTPAGDVLVHLAEEPDRSRVNKAGNSYLEKTAATIDALLKKKYQRVIYGSSAVVYGEGEQPFREDAELVATDWYSKAKLSNERMITAAGGVVVRFSNVIGFEMSLNNVVSHVLSQIPGAGALTVRNAKPIRDFIWQGDVIAALLLLIQSNCQGIFNVGSGVGISIEELASMALQHANEACRLVQPSQPNNSPSMNIVDIRKMKAELEWSPQMNLSESIKLLLDARASSNSERL